MKKNIKKEECSCSSCCTGNIFLKRFIVCISLGILFGIICTWIASINSPRIWELNNPLMWNILFNRFFIGLVIAIAGVYYVHPIFGFRFYPVIRGAIFGILVSLQMAIGIFLYSNLIIDFNAHIQLFWLTLSAGAIYGAFIDLIASKIGGEGEELLYKK